ncbi:MAG: tRNA pseudouridine(55) synthase TruB [Cyanobacteria bacterium RI_101]|nr:tRNA pseudouridine(55) synthase TruB [Cyanobacteria bacterium RI_101]
MLGFLNLHKPEGWTSHDCVAKIRRLAQTRRVGHGGTLDPLATGVLPLALGAATRLLPYLPKRKQYRGTIRFGVVTATDDLGGEILRETETGPLTLEALWRYQGDFLGAIQQIPPQFSAVHQDGRRLYDLARAGITVDVPPREVEVFAIELIEWRPGAPAELEVEITCGEGVYIRSIARDWGEKMGTGATLARLERRLSGGMALEESVPLAVLLENPEALPNWLISPQVALAHLPRLTLEEPEVRRWRQGQRLPCGLEPGPALIQSAGGEFLGVGETKNQEDGAVLHPKVVLTEGGA